MRSEREELAYFGGYFDGEGCILVVKQSETVYRLDVRITSIEFTILERFQKAFGGWIGNQGKNFKVMNSRPCKYWACSSSTAKAFLEKLLPWLDLKKVQAQTAIDFQNEIASGDRDLQKLAAYKSRLSELKNAEGRTTPAFDLPSDEELARAAGLMDGEGTILIAQAKGSYWLTVKIANTDLELLKKLKSLFGGGIAEKSDGRVVKCWDWLTTGKAAGEFLARCIPYMAGKRAQAEIGLEYQDGKKAMYEAGASADELRAFGESCKNRISSLNRTGPEEVLRTKFE